MALILRLCGGGSDLRTRGIKETLSRVPSARMLYISVSGAS